MNNNTYNCRHGNTVPEMPSMKTVLQSLGGNGTCATKIVMKSGLYEGTVGALLSQCNRNMNVRCNDTLVMHAAGMAHALSRRNV